MADILKFVGFGRRQPAATAPAGVFEEATPISAMGAGANNAIAHGLRDDCAFRFEAGRAYAAGDWTNQELADLYRVEALLIQANIRIETTRGVSDEGEPWFVFCHADGEVFVHLARIDGAYVLDGPGLDTVLRGQNFATLIDRFASAVARRTASGNIVQFRPGATDSVVRLHPAVMLAALVWSLYLASDHFVGTAHAGETDADNGLGILPPSLVQPTAGPAHEQSAKAPVDVSHLLVARENELSRNGFHNDGASPSWGMTGAAAGIAAGLTAIAVSFGLYDSDLAERTSGTVSHDAAEASRMALDSAHASPAMQGSLPTDTAGAENSENPAPAEMKVTEVDPVTLALQAITYAQAALAHLDTIVASGHTTHSSVTQALPFHQAEMAAAQGEAIASQSVTVAKPAASDTHDLKFLVTLAAEHLGEVSNYTLAGLSVDATFDISTLSKQTKQLVLADLSESSAGITIPPVDSAITPTGDAPQAEVIAQYLPYDTAAKSFVYQFLLLSDSIEMIKSDNMVVFIDTSAVDDPSDHAYSVSWISDDNFIVSTIGHAQDFAGLSLV